MSESRSSHYKVVGLIGHPVGHSLSPVLQNTGFRVCDLKMCYHAFDVAPDSVEIAVKGMVKLGFAGFNVTVPHKEAVLSYMDELDEQSKLIGAVNTVVVKNGRTYGYNTDGMGFIRSLQEKGIKADGKNILILGAGGAARAAAAALAAEGASSMVVANRTIERAQQIVSLVKELGVKGKAVGIAPEEINSELPHIDIIVNATPLGMYPKEDKTPLPNISELSSQTVVCDLIYKPQKTVLLQEAEEKGSRVVGGLGMLLHQGTEAFRFFTGVEPPVEEMREALFVATKNKM